MKEGGGFYERVIGGTEEEKKETAKTLQQFFENPDKELAEYELEKTPEDMRILKRTETIVDSTVEHYGGNPKPLPFDNIYILKPGSVSKMTNGEFNEGIHFPLTSKIGVEKGESELMFASGVAHELFHAKSYKSARVGPSAGDARLYRSGLSMVDRKDLTKKHGTEKEYFGMLEEAIVAECTKRFLKELSKEPHFRKEIEAVKTIKDWVAGYYRHIVGMAKGEPKKRLEKMLGSLDDELIFVVHPQKMVANVLKYSDDELERQAYATGIIQGLHKGGGVESMERYKERKMMYALLDELVEKSNGRFKNRDEAFGEFARANFSGNYLPLARIVEDILGKGSFRRLANEFATEKETKNEPD